MRKQWIAILSLTALLVAGSLAGAAIAQTSSPSDTDSAVAGEGDDRDSGGGGAGREQFVESIEEDGDDSDGAKPGKERFVELLAENLGISEDETRAALDATYEQLQEERRAAWEQAVRDALAKAVEAGKITQEEADEKLAAFLDGDDDGERRSLRGFGKRGHHGFRGGHGHHGGWFGWGADKDSGESGESGDGDEDAAA